MILLQVTLTELLSGRTGINPAFWDCPIQEGLPILLNTAKSILLWLAAFGFIVGINITIFTYIFAFGNEEKAKKAKDTLRWTFIGAIVVMLSAYMVAAIANALLAESEAQPVLDDKGRIVVNGNLPSECRARGQVGPPKP